MHPLFKPWLTHTSLTSDTLPNMVLKSLVDSGSSDSFNDSVFVQTQHLPAYGIPAYQTSTHWWNLQFCSSRRLWTLQICFLMGNPRIWLFTSLCWIRVHNCTRIPLAHPLQSLDWLRIGKIFFWQPSQHESRAHLCRDTSIVGTLPNPPTLSRTSGNLFHQ